ncbi:arylesterase [Noviherbaspirillum sp. CPCC 100848]|uniref:Arylesterase n=1 Tax=Noviherbaspirillum album TaxID=3080276 RepID=A0ABU6JEF4_9BURK|nr:arylesterase [Noviherbaspirillum sp. CPCC 100848]MEC4721836.1 arylesterase [Noviherbaspirillum sp. CPCC 100848]
MLTIASACAHSAPKTLLVLGDSLSAEYGLARGSGWVALLEKKIRQEKIDAVIVNASISGETTSGGKARLPALLNQHRPDVVVIELGGNDGLRGLPVKAAMSNLNDMVKAAQTAKAKVLLVGMQIPPNYGQDYARQFSRMYGTIAKEANIGLVPFLLEGVAERPELFQADRIHPQAEAQPIMLDNMWPHLKPLLSK